MSPPAAAAPFPWGEVMAFGMGRLGWPPERFWQATPREIGAALKTHQQDRPAPAQDLATLRALMAAHPDAATAPGLMPERRSRNDR